MQCLPKLLCLRPERKCSSEQKSNPINFLPLEIWRLLRLRRNRPDNRAAEKPDEFPPPHGPSPRQRNSYLSTFADRAALCITARLGGRCPLWVISGHFATSGRCPL